MMLKRSSRSLIRSRLLTMFLAAALALTAFACPAFSEDMGVVLISGPEEEQEPVSLDDIKLNTEYEIENYGLLTFLTCKVYDHFYIDNYSQSGTEAQYLILRMNLINTATKAVPFLQDYSVRVIYDEVYEYQGWARQFEKWGIGSVDKENGGKLVENDTKIGALYQGYFCFGCTLPNFIFTNEKPLRMEITMDGNEFTYYVRK